MKNRYATKIKDKDKILNSRRERQQITCKGTLIRLSADFSTETLQARREWHNIFKIMKGKKLQPRILYPARLLFRENLKPRIILYPADLTEKAKAFQRSKS